MKNFVKVASVLAVFAGSSAMAKTEGNYVGVDLLTAQGSFQYKNSGVNTLPKFDNSRRGYSLNYRYAFNFDKAFVAPGVFFDQLAIQGVDSNGDRAIVNRRYGVKLDLGYDITNRLAAYFTNGFAYTNYASDWRNNNSTLNSGVKKGNDMSYFYGIGAKFDLKNNFSLNVEYNKQSLRLKNPDATYKTVTELDVYKVGLAYNF